MSFPALLILGQNLSFVFMLILFYNIFSLNTKLKLNKVAGYAAFIAIGVIISVIDVEKFDGSLNRALIVLPNYIYWCLILVILSSYLHKINMYIIYRGVAYGIVSSLIYYFIQDYFTAIPFFRTLYGNGFAFLMICFSPIAMYYYLSKGKRRQSIVLLVAILAAMLLQGRRAGILLVSFEAFILFFFIEVKARNIAISVIALITIAILFNTSFVKNYIQAKSDRIYIILYETVDVKTQDQSYLTRRAMVNKGLQIFEENRFTGIGLNNFVAYNKIDINLDFEGGELLKYKDLSEKSAHNSYISILAEGGLLLFVPVILLFITTILFFIRNYNSIDKFKKPVFLGFVGMCVHMYVISAIVNVNAWFLIAIAATYTIKKQMYYYPSK